MSQIKAHSANGRNYLIVQVPKETREHNVDDDALIFVWVEVGTPDYIDLPPGQYTLLFIAEDATEEQAENVVQHFLGETDGVEGYKEYDPQTVLDLEYDGFRSHKDHTPYIKAIHSLNSLIRSLFHNSTDYKHVILERHD